MRVGSALQCACVWLYTCAALEARSFQWRIINGSLLSVVLNIAPKCMDVLFLTQTGVALQRAKAECAPLKSNTYYYCVSFVVFAVWANTSTKRKNAFFIFPQNHVLHRTFTSSAILAHKKPMSAGHRENFQNRLCFLQTQPRFALSSIQSFSHFHAFTCASNVPHFLRWRNKGRSSESWRRLKQLGTIGIGSTGAKGASWATNGEM
jgi:hypothetical protein